MKPSKSSSEDISEEESEDEHKVAKPEGRTIVGAGRASRPGYGHVRVADLDHDLSSDEEKAPLRAHRDFCEKCQEGPAPTQMKKVVKSRKHERSKTSDDELSESGDELGGWVTCLKCPVAVHWGCLTRAQREEILRAAQEIDSAAWLSARPENELKANNPRDLKANKAKTVKKRECDKGGFCIGCTEIVLQPHHSPGQDVEMKDVNRSHIRLKHDATPLLFRCFLCKRAAHYEHISYSAGDVATSAEHHQNNWLCKDCVSFSAPLDKILAWRPYPQDAVESPTQSQTLKDPFPRQYLVKWVGRSFRRTQWVPHTWLAYTQSRKLQKFLTDGPPVDLLESGVGDNTAVVDSSTLCETVDDSGGSSVKPGNLQTPKARPLPDAERRIPPEWKTVDRVLDVRMWRPTPQSAPEKRQGKAKGKTESKDDGALLEAQRAAKFDGEQPADQFTQTLADWEERTDNEFDIDRVDGVASVFTKWRDLTYEEATWDSPPRPEEPGYLAFNMALSRFITSRTVFIRDGKKPASADRAIEGYSEHRLEEASDLGLGQDPSLKLMDYQIDGFNWLCDNWWNRQHCILADDMGLGKTVQTVTFLGKIIKDFEASPVLVLVPKSTLTNWVREFELWAPIVRVVPFYGKGGERAVMKKFELYHDDPQKGCTKAKFHVLLTTFETLLADFTVFKNQPRWEVLVVDEAQRLKNDSSILFGKLKELNTLHRVMLTGTPMSNSIRELFTLLSFLDPEEWSDLEGLTRKHEELTEGLVSTLHELLRPYFMRRTKGEVLKLPPKNEIIVPVSMTPLQKQIYDSILNHNSELLVNVGGNMAIGASKESPLGNVLLRLRKCLQHPYLCEEDLEPRGLSDEETHKNLVDASAKLRLLKVLLPKLKARGHRVLIFSQFVIALDIIEDFVQGEGFRYLRLDGQTVAETRQRDIDTFNSKDSGVFIYLLSTRAGGVGINLFTADTVIIFDPDFNPQQDAQAVARAYRYGQKKTCLVFKLMVKDSVEERIVQIGKKKLVLDHLIVQKMDHASDDAGDEVESMLTYGAKELFEVDAGAARRDVFYNEADIDQLIESTEKADQSPVDEPLSFTFAKVWVAGENSLEEVVENNDSSSRDLLQRLSKDPEMFRTNDAGGDALRQTKRSRLCSGSHLELRSDLAIDGPLSPIHDDKNCNGEFEQGCQFGECMMGEKSEHLAEFRKMLILHSDEEPLEKRIAGIAAIDRILQQRGDASLVAGQPLEVVPRSAETELPGQDQTANLSGSSAMTTNSATLASIATTRRPPRKNAGASSSKRVMSPAAAGDPSPKET